MKEIIKTIGVTIAVGAAMVLFVGMAVNAVDAQGTENRIQNLKYRLENDPESIDDEYIEYFNKTMSDDKQFEIVLEEIFKEKCIGGAPEFVYYELGIEEAE